MEQLICHYADAQNLLRNILMIMVCKDSYLHLIVTKKNGLYTNKQNNIWPKQMHKSTHLNQKKKKRRIHLMTQSTELPSTISYIILCQLNHSPGQLNHGSKSNGWEYKQYKTIIYPERYLYLILNPYIEIKGQGAMRLVHSNGDYISKTIR